MNVGTLRAPVRFRRLSGAEVLAQSEFQIPLSQAAADPGAPAQPGETTAQAAAAAWTLWGRGTASSFDGNVFTGHLGLDYRLPYAHWGPRPGLGV